ncbi:hypothetical protein BC828DRAFT_433866 [Blastocladiella britannica]|nr:hypothetical protein BC828DRAFT_433866 [Blastocladiella britannica]
MTAGTAAPALELPLAAGALWSALVHAAARTPTLASHGHLLATIYRGLHSLSECASDYDESLQIPSRRSGPPLPIPINFDAVSVMLVTAEFLSRAGVLSTDHQQWTPILNALLSLSLSRAMWTGQRRLSEQCAVSIAQILHMLRESGHHANAQREMEQFAMAVAQEWASHAPFECTLPTIAAIFEFAHGQEWMPPTPFLRQIVAALPSLANDALYSLTARAATMLLVTPAPLHPDSSASNKDEVARAIVEAVFDPFTARTFAWYSLVDGLRSVALHYLESATEHQPGDPHFGALDLLFSAIVLHSHPQNPSPTALGHHHPSPLAEFDQLRFVHDMLSEARAIHAPRTPILDQPQLLAQWLARQIRAGLSANAAALAVCGMAHVARITGTSVPTLWPTVIVSAHSWAHHPAYLDAVLDALAIVPVSALDSPSLLEALHLVNSTRSAALRQRFAQWMASVFSGDLASPIPNALPEFLRTAHRDFSTAERGLLATAMETQSSDLISSVRRILAPEPAAAPIQSHMLVVVHHPTELLQMSARATTPMPPDHIASDSNIPSSSPLPFDAGEVWRQVVQFNTLGTWAFVELASANLALDTYSPALDVLGVVFVYIYFHLLVLN